MVFTTCPTLLADSFIAIDAEGFESPAYSDAFTGDGRLEGQVASIDGGFASTPWARLSSTGGIAAIQSEVVASGSQALRVDRAANSDNYWAVPVSVYPLERYIEIEWRMRVEQANSGGFGPYFGIEAFDDSSLLGSFGADATTGDLLYKEGDTGLFRVTGEQFEFGVWNQYKIVLDYQEDSYSAYFNGSLVAGTGFVDGSQGLDGFSSADISATKAGGDPASVSAIGTAYFDDYLVTETDVLSQPVGDYDQNGVIDPSDYVQWQSSYGSSQFLAADGNGNGIVDSADYTVWRDNYESAATATALPEPSLAPMLLSCVTSLLAYRHRS